MTYKTFAYYLRAVLVVDGEFISGERVSSIGLEVILAPVYRNIGAEIYSARNIIVIKFANFFIARV